MSKVFSKEADNIREIETLEELKDFFENHSLEESRNILWKWLNISGSSGFNKLSMKEREELLMFYAHLQGLLEAVHKIKIMLDKDDALQASVQ